MRFELKIRKHRGASIRHNWKEDVTSKGFSHVLGRWRISARFIQPAYAIQDAVDADTSMGILPFRSMIYRMLANVIRRVNDSVW